MFALPLIDFPNISECVSFCVLLAGVVLVLFIRVEVEQGLISFLRMNKFRCS